MAITDELREYVRHYSVAGSSKDKTLTAIADRIDAAHRSALEKLAAQLDESEDGYTREDTESAFVSGYSLGCLPVGSDPTWNQNEQTIDEHMAEWGWMRLPVDADGMPICIGDVMEWPTTGETFEVVGIGDGTLFYIEDTEEQADWTGASTKRHHRAPTVEDVLREMCIEIDRRCERGSIDYDELFAEYTAKLMLKED